MNLWQGFNTYPALLLSGKTGSGKTAMQRILKAMI
jgi:Flp pilus assembly CpaF family ATPase